MDFHYTPEQDAFRRDIRQWLAALDAISYYDLFRVAPNATFDDPARDWWIDSDDRVKTYCSRWA